MLTGDLASSFRRGERVFPRLVPRDDQNYLRDAANLIEIFENSIGRTREDLKNEFEEYLGTGTDYKILRGFEKLLLDRSEFQTESIAEPIEIRRALFVAAKSFHPILDNNRHEVLAQIAADFNCQTNEIEAALYADLSAQQRLLEFETLTDVELIDRYNLAQAQAIFYRCGEMKIWIAPSAPAVYRQIFAAIKHYKLIHTINGDAKNGYEVTLNGAASVFHRSQKYGLQMSVFLPALLNCQNWRMQAEIDSKDAARALYELDAAQTELRSHFVDEPEYENPVHEKLRRDWAKTETDWTLHENQEIVNFGRLAAAPDFVLKRGKQKVYLEILGFWTPNSLEKRTKELQAAKFQNVIVAAWEELRGSRDAPLNVPENVILFKSKLEPQTLAATAEKLLEK